MLSHLRPGWDHHQPRPTPPSSPASPPSSGPSSSSLIAVYAIQHGGKGHVVETGLSIASVAYGCLLGVFLLGTLTKYATQTGAILGMIAGLALNLHSGSSAKASGLPINPHPTLTSPVHLPTSPSPGTSSSALCLPSPSAPSSPHPPKPLRRTLLCAAVR